MATYLTPSGPLPASGAARDRVPGLRAKDSTAPEGSKPAAVDSSPEHAWCSRRRRKWLECGRGGKYGYRKRRVVCSKGQQRRRHLATSAHSYAGYFAGNVYATGSYSSSDARLKKNIAPLADALPTLLKLKGVTFEWNRPEDYGNQTGTQRGFIAQEVEKVFPN